MVGEVSYLVKKQCTFVGNLEFPRTVCPSIGKCTFDMSKQFAFEKSFRDGPHIDWDQCLLFPVGKYMDLAGKHLLTCPVFPSHQYVGIRPGYFFN